MGACRHHTPGTESRSAAVQRLYTTPLDAAMRVGMTADGIRAGLRRGTVPGKKFGTRWRVLESWVKQREEQRG